MANKFYKGRQNTDPIKFFEDSTKKHVQKKNIPMSQVIQRFLIKYLDLGPSTKKWEL